MRCRVVSNLKVNVMSILQLAAFAAHTQMLLKVMIWYSECYF